MLGAALVEPDGVWLAPVLEHALAAMAATASIPRTRERLEITD
jgi:hypothetical protein